MDTVLLTIVFIAFALLPFTLFACLFRYLSKKLKAEKLTWDTQKTGVGTGADYCWETIVCDWVNNKNDGKLNLNL